MGQADADLAGILTELVTSGEEVGFRSGTVTEWNPDTGENSIVVSGASLQDLPFVSNIEALAIKPGDVVGIIRARSQFFVLGRILVTPGAIEIRDSVGRVTVQIDRASGGGRVGVYHDSGNFAMLSGPLTFNGIGVGRGFLVEQSDGTDIISASPETPGGPMLIRMFGASGHRLFRTDPGGLMDRPYQDVPMYPVFANGQSWTSSTSYTTLWHGRMWVTHPALVVGIRAWTDGGVSGGAWGVWVDGVQLGTNESFSGTTAQFLGGDTRPLPSSITGTPYSYYRVEIRARRTGGTVGNIYTVPYGVTKRGL